MENKSKITSGFLLKDIFKFSGYLLKKDSIRKLNHFIRMIIVIIGVSTQIIYLTSCDSSVNKSNNSNKESSSIYGKYSDFSSWSQGIEGNFVVNKDKWSGYIDDNGNITNYNGITNGTDLLDEYGSGKVGYLANKKLYIYYLNGYYPVGR